MLMQKRKGEFNTFEAQGLRDSGFNAINDAKKVRLESGTINMTLSRVLYLRGLPTDVTESEVASLAIPFGELNNMVLTKKTGQALLELVSQDAATAMVQYYSGVCPPSIRGTSHIVVQFSKHAALTTPEAGQHITDAILTANKHAAAWSLESSQKSIIRVQVERAPPQLQFNYMMFYKIFRQYGDILKIVVFKSAQVPQALIEFENALSAHVAKLQTNSLPLLPSGGSGCGVMRVDFSRQEQLEVRRENDSCRDFTVNPISDQELSQSQVTSAGLYGDTENSTGYRDNIASINAAQYLSATTGAGSLLDNKGNIDSVALASIAGRVIQPLLSAAVGRGGQVDTALLRQQLAALQQLAPQASGLDSSHNFHMDGIQQQDMSSGASASPVIIVSGLDIARVTPDTLFILFGVYGDVQRVKILYNKKDTALVQFTDSSQAASAVSNLNGVSLYGSPIRCSISKHFSIKISQRMHSNNDNNGDDSQTVDSDSGTKDYSNHRLHRFKRANSRNHQNVYPPSSVLHVSNLPETSEADLKQIFQAVTGSPVVHCKIMANEKRMAFVQFESVEKAIAALIEMHNYQLTESNRIRVSFSKSMIRE